MISIIIYAKGLLVESSSKALGQIEQLENFRTIKYNIVLRLQEKYFRKN